MRGPVVAFVLVVIVSTLAVGSPAEAERDGGRPGVVAGRAAASAARGAVGFPDPASCPATLRGAVIDRQAQRAWLCEVGAIVRVMPITSAGDQPDPGIYEVYAEDLWTTSYYGPQPSTLDHFVAFTRGKYEGARIGFHAVPRYGDGTLAQSAESVGTPELFGGSSGCIRLRAEDAAAVYDFLAVGHQVHVIS